MKTIRLLCISLALFAGSLSAQDTIVYGTGDVYLFDDDTIAPTYDCRISLLTIDYPYSHGVPMARAYHTDSEILVYGVAIAIENFVVANSPTQRDSINDIMNRARLAECFMATLYQKDGDSLILVDTVPWNSHPQERFIKYTGINYDSTCITLNYGDTITEITHTFEFYFKRPHWVRDTFYVGKYDKKEASTVADSDVCQLSANDSGLDLDFVDRIIPQRNGDAKWIYFPDWGNPNSYEEGFVEPLRLFLNEIGDTTTTIFSYIHPILKPRTDICFAPDKPWMTERTGTSATFEWGEIEDSAQLVIGDYLGNPDTMAAIALGPGSTGYTVAGLEPGTYYGAWLRQRCHWQLQEGDSTRWSDWSERVIFSTELEGIAAAEEVSCNVYPNPAHGAFTVETDAQQARLALYNAHGTELYVVDLRSPRTTIGIADLPVGVYFIVLTTPDGTATRRLVNEP